MKYDNSSVNGTGISDGYWRAGTDLASPQATTYTITSATISDLDLETLWKKVIQKRGYTIYWLHYLHSLKIYYWYRKRYNWLFRYIYFFLDEGYIFDGNVIILIFQIIIIQQQ